jgi:hypothetical protein
MKTFGVIITEKIYKISFPINEQLNYFTRGRKSDGCMLLL